jgi:ferric iron reductase protein FhuF
LSQLLEAQDLEVVFAPYRSHLGSFNRWVNPSNDPDQAATEGEVIPASRLLEPAFLRATLRRWGETLGANNLKVEASLWAKYYCTSFYPLVLGAMTLGGLGLDATLANTQLVLSRTAGLRQFEGIGYPIRAIFLDNSQAVGYAPRCETPGLTAKATRQVDSAAQLQQIVFKRLFEGHLSPLFEQFQAVTKVSPKILWGNLGAGIFAFYATLSESAGDRAALTDDSTALLDNPYNKWIAPGKNPLYQPVVLRHFNEAGLTEPVRVRTSCCLWYKVPQAQKCAACPLLKPVEIAERLKVLAAR